MGGVFMVKSSGFRPGKAGILPLLVVALLLASCAGTGDTYMGIPLAPGAADPQVQALARSAMGGDKQAQLRLGSYFQSAADGYVWLEQEAAAGRAQIEDVKYVRSIFDAGTSSKLIRKYGWKPLALARARELYQIASIDSAVEKHQSVARSSSGGAVTTSPTSTGPIQKGLAEAKKRLLLIDDAIFRQKFQTSFIDPIGEACYTDFPEDFWHRNAHFIVEGMLSYNFVDPSEYPEHHRPGASLAYRTSDHYKARIEISRFVKWPEQFPRPQELSFKSYVTDGHWLEDHAGRSGGCITWGPRGEPNNSNAIVVLEYINSPVGEGRFEIIRTFRK